MIDSSNASLVGHPSARTPRQSGNTVYRQREEANRRTRAPPWGDPQTHPHNAETPRTARMDRSEEYMEKLLLNLHHQY